MPYRSIMLPRHYAAGQRTMLSRSEGNRHDAGIDVMVGRMFKRHNLGFSTIRVRLARNRRAIPVGSESRYPCGNYPRASWRLCVLDLSSKTHPPLDPRFKRVISICANYTSVMEKGIAIIPSLNG
jgi:hypothetical protein